MTFRLFVFCAWQGSQTWPQIVGHNLPALGRGLGPCYHYIVGLGILRGIQRLFCCCNKLCVKLTWGQTPEWYDGKFVTPDWRCLRSFLISCCFLLLMLPQGNTPSQLPQLSSSWLCIIFYFHQNGKYFPPRNRSFVAKCKTIKAEQAALHINSIYVINF